MTYDKSIVEIERSDWFAICCADCYTRHLLDIIRDYNQKDEEFFPGEIQPDSKRMENAYEQIIELLHATDEDLEREFTNGKKHK